jgi:hypothetical protein
MSDGYGGSPVLATEAQKLRLSVLIWFRTGRVDEQSAEACTILVRTGFAEHPQKVVNVPAEAGNAQGSGYAPCRPITVLLDSWSGLKELHFRGCLDRMLRSRS